METELYYQRKQIQNTNRLSYSRFEIRLVNVLGFMRRCSRNSYKLTLNFSRSDLQYFTTKSATNITIMYHSYSTIKQKQNWIAQDAHITLLPKTYCKMIHGIPTAS